MRANAASDYQLCGLGPLLAPLYNSGVLDALDLHTYFDVNVGSVAAKRSSMSSPLLVSNTHTHSLSLPVGSHARDICAQRPEQL